MPPTFVRGKLRRETIRGRRTRSASVVLVRLVGDVGGEFDIYIIQHKNERRYIVCVLARRARERRKDAAIPPRIFLTLFSFLVYAPLLQGYFRAVCAIVVQLAVDFRGGFREILKRDTGKIAAQKKRVLTGKLSR